MIKSVPCAVYPVIFLVFVTNHPVGTPQVAREVINDMDNNDENVTEYLITMRLRIANISLF